MGKYELSNIKHVFGSYATTGCSLKIATYATNGFMGVDSNMQLRHWIDAKVLYFSKVAGTATPNLDDMISVVINLGHSLSSLFGQNFIGDVRTPYLLAFVDQANHKSGYSLENEDQALFKRLQHLNEIFNDVAKHPDASKRDKMESFTRDEIADLMETTKRVWIWFGHHRYPKGIPTDQLTEFGDTFASLEQGQSQ
jgi:hypothetical protein